MPNKPPRTLVKLVKQHGNNGAAELLSCDKATVSRVMSGKHRISASLAQKLAAITGGDAAKILWGGA